MQSVNDVSVRIFRVFLSSVRNRQFLNLKIRPCFYFLTRKMQVSVKFHRHGKEQGVALINVGPKENSQVATRDPCSHRISFFFSKRTLIVVFYCFVVFRMKLETF